MRRQYSWRTPGRTPTPSRAHAIPLPTGMASLTSFRDLDWKKFAKKVWAEIGEDEVFERAAQLSYYFLLALFPALLFMTAVVGWIAGEDSELRASLFRSMATVLPGEASKLVSDTINDVMQGSGGGKISFGILATLWAASNGMGAISSTLNVAYEVKERRPWWKVRATAVALTIALALLIISALVLLLYGHDIAETVAGKFGLGLVFEITWKIVQWPLLLVFLLTAFGMIYYFGPDVREQKWQWITPGAVFALGLWLLVSFAFKLYLEFFNSYNATYGSLGAVIILMLWFYLSGAAILIGGEINSEFEAEMAERGEPDAKDKGEKAPGQADPAPLKRAAS